MQSDLLADFLSIEESLRTAPPVSADFAKAPAHDSIEGAQQFLVEWEVPEPA